MPEQPNPWLVETGGSRGPAYARRFRELAESGQDVHGEARFLDRLLAPGARVLDAGCGTGRVAAELARRGHEVVGVDLDASMLAEARREHPGLHWVHGDLAGSEAPAVGLAELGGRPFDLVVAAGNVVVYLTPGTEPGVVALLAGLLRDDGLLVAGFALDRHVSAADYDTWCRAAGLVPVAVHQGWDDAGSDDAGSDDAGAGAVEAGWTYAVHVHRRVPRQAREAREAGS